jgi:CMP-N,N'-diacetyllegionaminic acid synthase
LISGNRVLGLVPARGGSKRLPGKNIRPLCGKPLLAWTVEAALGSSLLDRVVLSSDDEEIIGVAAQYGCEVPFRRPAHLADDSTPGVEPVLHALDQLDGFDYVVMLQPTSPLRTAEDIDNAVLQCVSRGAPSCVSVVPVAKPQWMFMLDEETHLQPISAEGRESTGTVFLLNGAVYVAHVSMLRQTRLLVGQGTVGYVMPPHRSIDVDTEYDLRVAESLMSRHIERLSS